MFSIVDDIHVVWHAKVLGWNLCYLNLHSWCGIMNHNTFNSLYWIELCNFTKDAAGMTML